eukprot:s184_g15.t3
MVFGNQAERQHQAKAHYSCHTMQCKAIDQEVRLRSPERSFKDRFGRSVSISGDTVADLSGDNKEMTLYWIFKETHWSTQVRKTQSKQWNSWQPNRNNTYPTHQKGQGKGRGRNNDKALGDLPTPPVPVPPKPPKPTAQTQHFREQAASTAPFAPDPQDALKTKDWEAVQGDMLEVALGLSSIEKQQRQEHTAIDDDAAIKAHIQALCQKAGITLTREMQAQLQTQHETKAADVHKLANQIAKAQRSRKNARDTLEKLQKDWESFETAMAKKFQENKDKFLQSYQQWHDCHEEARKIETDALRKLQALTNQTHTAAAAAGKRPELSEEDMPSLSIPPAPEAIERTDVTMGASPATTVIDHTPEPARRLEFEEPKSADTRTRSRRKMTRQERKEEKKEARRATASPKARVEKVPKGGKKKPPTQKNDLDKTFSKQRAERDGNSFALLAEAENEADEAG